MRNPEDRYSHDATHTILNPKIMNRDNYIHCKDPKYLYIGIGANSENLDQTTHRGAACCGVSLSAIPVII